MSAPPAPLLQVTNLEAGYGQINVLHKLSLVVNAGEVVTIIGANGAGKSTTLNTICGIVKTRAGSISFDGRSLPSGEVTYILPLCATTISLPRRLSAITVSFSCAS